MGSVSSGCSIVDARNSLHQGRVAVIMMGLAVLRGLNVHFQLVARCRVGDDPGEIAALLCQIAIDRADHIANLKTSLFRCRSRDRRW